MLSAHKVQKCEEGKKVSACQAVTDPSCMCPWWENDMDFEKEKEIQFVEILLCVWRRDGQIINSFYLIKPYGAEITIPKPSSVPTLQIPAAEWTPISQMRELSFRVVRWLNGGLLSKHLWLPGQTAKASSWLCASLQSGLGKSACCSVSPSPHLYAETITSACRVALGLNAVTCVELPTLFWLKEGLHGWWGDC